MQTDLMKLVQIGNAAAASTTPTEYLDSFGFTFSSLGEVIRAERERIGHIEGAEAAIDGLLEWLDGQAEICKLEARTNGESAPSLGSPYKR